jgi:hypothetical protein
MQFVPEGPEADVIIASINVRLWIAVHASIERMGSEATRSGA